MFICEQSLPVYKATDLLSPQFVMNWSTDQKPQFARGTQWLLPYARAFNLAYLAF